MKNVVYIADIDQDIDDLIAIEYLQEQGVLKYIVLDNAPTSQLAKERIAGLQQKGLQLEEHILDGEDVLFVGGSLKKVREFLEREEKNKITLLVMNGGFVGNNIVKEHALKKFSEEMFVRTYNFNLDVKSTEYVLASDKIKNIYLIGKNVCHSEKNTTAGMWRDLELLQSYHLSNKKRLHDLLMVDEGVKLLSGNEMDSKLMYGKIKVMKMKEEPEDKLTKWGSQLAMESHIFAAIGWKLDK